MTLRTALLALLIPATLGVGFLIEDARARARRRPRPIELDDALLPVDVGGSHIVAVRPLVTTDDRPFDWHVDDRDLG